MGAYVNLLEGHAERLGEALLGGGAWLVLLLEVGFEDVMLLFGQARLDFLADRVGRRRLVEADVWFGGDFEQGVRRVGDLVRIGVGRHCGRIAVHVGWRRGAAARGVAMVF